MNLLPLRFFRRAVQRSTIPLIVCLFTVYGNSKALATAYYVNDAVTNGDVYVTAVGAPANDGLTPATPKLTVTNLLAIYSLNAGDIVYIDTGTYSNYTVTVTSSGTATNPIVFKGSTNFIAGGTVFSRNSAAADAWSLSSVSYVHLLNMTFRNARDGILLNLSKDSRLERITSRNNSRYGMFLAVFSDRNVIQNCIVAFNSDYQVFVQNSSNVLFNSSVSWGNFGFFYQQSFGGPMFISNSVIRAAGLGNAVIRRGGEILSDYNIYLPESNAVVSTTSTTTFDSNPRLSDWQSAYNTDWRSTSIDPLFADAANVDFHPRSEFGRYTASGTFTNDTVTSPLIDMGSPQSSFANETSPNGARLNASAYGNTAEASRSSTNRSLIALTYNDGGVLSGTGSLYWAGGNLQTNDRVTVEYSLNGGSTWSIIATNIPATNQVINWNASAAGSSGASKWRVRLTTPALTNVIGTSFGVFSVRNTNLTFYVNDASTSGDLYTSALGNSTNLGTTPSTPKDSLAHVLVTHTVSGGDVIYIDTGSYTVTNTIFINYRHRGTVGNPVIITGPTNVLSGGAVLDRNNTASDVISLSSAPYMTFRHLDVRRGNDAISISQSVGVSVENCVLRQNQVNGVDYEPGSHNGVMRYNVIANNVTRSFTVAATNIIADNNTIYATKGVFITSGGTLRFENNIARNSGSGNSVFESLAGFSNLLPSDGYNVYHLESGAAMAKVGVITYQLLTDYQKASGRDWRSTSMNPEFYDPANYDFHVRSQNGRWEGISFVTTDTVTSVSIDLGNPTNAFANELAPNGGRINAGAYGNNPEASKSRTNAWLTALTYQDGGTLNVPSDSVYWNYGGLVTGATVRIELSTDGGDNWSVIATNISATAGTYLWANTNFNSSRFARWRVVYENDPTVVGSLLTNIVLRNGPFVYYVNDSSVAGDVYTTAPGNNGNLGTSAGAPKSTLQSVIDTHPILPGDIIYIDTGNYTLTLNQEISVLDTGSTSEYVYVVGSTNTAAGGTVFNRSAVVGSAYGIHLSGASHYWIRDITLRGGGVGIQMDNSPGSRLERVRTHNNLVAGVRWNNSIGVRICNSASWLNGQGLVQQGTSQSIVEHVALWRNSQVGLQVDAGTVTFSNSVIVASGSLAFAYQAATLTNLVANYNNILLETQALVAAVSTSNQWFDSVSAWSQSTGQDLMSLAEEPLFASPQTGDFHLKTEASQGRYLPGVGFVLDSETSRLIDAGAKNAPFGVELSPNGGRVNMGVFGNTLESSKSITNQSLHAATHRQGGVATGTSLLHWVAYNMSSSDLVKVSYSRDGGVSWSNIATGLPATAESVLWNTTLVTNSPAGLWRVESESDPAISDQISRFFSIRNSPLSVFVNNSSTSGDVYTTAPGASTNWEASSSQPLNSLSLVANLFNLEPGDTVYIDTGSYFTSPLVLDRRVSGTSNTYVVIKGSTNILAGGTALQGSGVSVNSQLLTLLDTRFVAISNLTIRNARTGLQLERAVGINLSFFTATANSNGVSLRGATNIVINRSVFSANPGRGVINLGTFATNRIDHSVFIGNGEYGIDQTSGRLDVEHSVLMADGLNRFVYQIQSGSVLRANYNNVRTTNNASVARFGFTVSTSLNRWQQLLTNDVLSLSHDPRFANPVIGDYHVLSPAGRFDPASGVFVTSDTVQSPMLDAGNPVVDFADETAPNGQRRNIGLYGNHPEASRSTTNGVLYTLTLNDGGSTRDINTLYWLVNGSATGSLVHVDYSWDGGVNWTNIATNVAASAGSVVWNSLNFPSSAQAYWRVVSQSNPSIATTNEKPFSLNNTPLAYYVNDASTDGDVYCIAPGSPDNDGFTDFTPVDSIQTIINRYDLQPGDRILVDTGSYDIDSPVTVDVSKYSGVVTNPLQIIGSTNMAAGGSRINRKNGTVAFQFNRVNAVTLSHFTITNAVFGVRLSSSTNMVLEWLDIKGAGTGIELSGSRNTLMRHNVIRESKTNAVANLQSTGTVFQSSVLWSNATAIYVSLAVPPIVSGLDNFISVSNSAIVAYGSQSYVYSIESGALQANYNNILLTNNAYLARRTGGFYTRLYNSIEQWRRETGEDGSSLSSDANFVEPESGNFFLRSQAGRYHPVEGFQIDSITSPLIDAGAPTAVFTNEPGPNGGRINIGRYGNTPFASKTPSNGTLNVISFNDGGLVSGTNLIRWVSSGAATGHTIRIDLSLDAGSTFTNITTNVLGGLNSYTWDTTVHTSTVRAVLRFFNSTTTNVMDSTDKLFSIRNHPISYYLNDGSVSGDVYTTASGASSNSGLFASVPKRSLSDLLSTWDVEPGDTIFIDTGIYTNSALTTLSQLDAGEVTGTVSMIIQGSTNTMAGGSVFVAPPNGMALQLFDVSNVQVNDLTISGTRPLRLRRSENITMNRVKIVAGTIGAEMDSSRGIEWNQSSIQNASDKGLWIAGSSNVVWRNGVIWSNQISVTISQSTNYLGFSLLQNLVAISNSVIGSLSTNGVVFDAQVVHTINSDYNNVFRNPGSLVALINSTNTSIPIKINSLSEWTALRTNDVHSQSGRNPLFVNPDAIDFHPRSLGGRYDVSSQLFVLDVVHSPLIDSGAPGSPFSAESEPNGGRINIGIHGNTSEASRSITNSELFLLSFNDGGVARGTNQIISWSARGNASLQTVRIDVSVDGGLTWTNLSSNVAANAGTYVWNTTQHPSTPAALIRVISEQESGVSSTASEFFAIRNAPLAFYVNDLSTTGDVYTAAVGSPTNLGISAQFPISSLQDILSRWNMGPGDIVYVDTGVYTNNTDVFINQFDAAGFSNTVKVVIQGSTNDAAGGTLLLRNGGIGVNIDEAGGVKLRNIRISGAGTGVRLNRTEGIELEWVLIDHVGTGFEVVNSSNVRFSHCLARSATIRGVSLVEVQQASWTHGVLWSNAAGMRLNSTIGLSISNSVFGQFVTNSAVYTIENTFLTFASDFNAFFLTNGSRLATRTVSSVEIWPSVNQWNRSTGFDRSSLSHDPLFADAGNGDFHLRSQGGRFNTTSGVFVVDGITSPLIDAGNASDGFANETVPNGNRRNIGLYGNTAQASRTPTNSALVAVSINDGGRAESLKELKWVAQGLVTGHTVRLEYSSDDGMTWTPITTNLAASLERFVWDSRLFVSSILGYWRISSEQEPSVVDAVDKRFALRNSGLNFYVNDNSPIGDIYSSAGGLSTNWGIQSSAPITSVQNLFTLWDIEPGDTIYMDTGNYLITAPIQFSTENAWPELSTLAALAAGYATNRVLLQGSTNDASGGTLVQFFGSGNAIEINSAPGVKISDITVQGGVIGINVQNSPLTEVERVRRNGGSIGFNISSSSNSTFRQSVVRGTTSRALSVINSFNTRWENGVMWSNSVAFYQDGGLFDFSSLQIENSFVGAFGSNAVVHFNQSGSRVSDYNQFFLTNGAFVAAVTRPSSVITTRYENVSFWTRATGQDAHTVVREPNFANVNNGDYHLKTTAPMGRFNSITGLWTNDTTYSRMIDAGNPATPYFTEPSPNGQRINIGAYGGTGQASHTPTGGWFTVVSYYDGGSVQGEVTLNWIAGGEALGHLVSIDWSPVGDLAWTNVVTDIPASQGSITWNTVGFGRAACGKWRVVSQNNTNYYDTSRDCITLRDETGSIPYYVNDANVTGDVFCSTIGSSLNSGLLPSDPVNSIQQIINNYKLEPVDIIYVDTGNYLLTDSVSIGDLDSGSGTNRITVQGSTNRLSTGTVLDRQVNAGGTSVIRLENVSGLNFRDLTLRAAETGVLLQNVEDITFERVTVQFNGQYGFSLSFSQGVDIRNSVIRRNGSITNGSGIRLSFSSATLYNSVLWDNFNGVDINAGGLNVSNSVLGSSYEGGRIYNVGALSDVTAVNGDYNNYIAQSGATLAERQKTTGGNDYYLYLQDWVGASGQDSNSLSHQPLFIDSNNGNFSLPSQAGRFLPNGSTTNDVVTSPMIDTGDPISVFTNEVAPNGGRINIGRYGNTPVASHSVTNPWLLALTYNDGGIIQGTSRLSWTSGNVTNGSRVRIESSRNNGAEWFIVATNVLNETGSYMWDASGEPVTAQGKWRVFLEANTNVLDETDHVFAIKNNTLAIYVNDDSLVNDLYCPVVGNNLNSGLSNNVPLASVREAFTRYPLGPGDTIYIDTGIYTVTNSLILNEFIRGESGVVVRVQGNTNHIHRSTIQFVSARDGILLSNTKYIDIAHLFLTGASNGLAIQNSEDISLRYVNAHANSKSGFRFQQTPSLTLVGCTAWNNTEWGVDAATGLLNMQNAVIYNNGFGGLNLQNISLAINNSILHSAAGPTSFIYRVSQSVVANSDYNIIWVGSTNVILARDNQFGFNYQRMAEWQKNTGADVHSVLMDPLMMNPAAGDFSLLSQNGRFDADGNLVPSDGLTSWAIDAGRFDSAYALESQPNGNRINNGNRGNTPLASRSLTNIADRALYASSYRDGGTASGEITLYWLARSFSPTSTVRIEYSLNNGVTWNVAATNIFAVSGSFNWDTSLLISSPRVLWGVISEENTNVSSRLPAPFVLRNGPIAYYVNDTNTMSSVYTVAAGNITNDALSPTSPQISINEVLDEYDLDDGDTVYVDTGFYGISAPIYLGVLDSGTATSFVSIVGSSVGDGSVLYPTPEFTNDVFGLQFVNARYISVDHLTIQGFDEGALFELFSAGNRINSCLIRDNLQHGVSFDTCNNNTIVRSVITRTDGDAILSNGSSDNSLLHSIVWSNRLNAINLGFSSMNVSNSVLNAADTNYVYLLRTNAVINGDYNAFYIERPASFASILGVVFEHVPEWVYSQEQELYSLETDPRFNNTAADDFHLQSIIGRYDEFLGYYVDTDTNHSHLIDAGSIDWDFGNEPSPNGTRINMGIYGNTARASKSRTNAWLKTITGMGGGRLEGTLLLSWNSGNIPDNEVVILDYSYDNGISWTNIGTNVVSARAHIWQSDLKFPPDIERWPSSPIGRWRIYLASDTNIMNVTENYFSLRNKKFVYYLNDASTVGDIYTCGPGDDVNLGIFACQPKATLSSLLDVLDVEGDDTIVIDTGIYDIGTNSLWVLDPSDQGKPNLPVVILGSTNLAFGGSVMNRVGSGSSPLVTFNGGYVAMENVIFRNGGLATAGNVSLNEMTFTNSAPVTMSGDNNSVQNSVFYHSSLSINSVNGLVQQVTVSDAGIAMSGTNMTMRNTLVYGTNVTPAVTVSGFNILLENNTLATKGSAFVQTGLGGSFLRNNILIADGFDRFCIDAPSGTLVSDYNNLRAINNAWIGGYRNGNWEHLYYWQREAGQDQNSIAADPLFANASAGDFRLKSITGRWNGSTFVADANHSPSIDSGYPVTAFGLEPTPNGLVVNQGFDGNTPFASKSRTNLWLMAMTMNDGGVIKGTNALTWRAGNAGGSDLVRLEYSANNGVTWTTIVSGISATQTNYLWNSTTVPSSLNALWRVVLISNTNVFDINDTPFALRNTPLNFYVNDTNVAQDVYTSVPGNDSNDGLTPATPKRTLQSLLATYDTEGGDTVYVDTGNYLITSLNRVIWSRGGDDQYGPVIIQGSTNLAAGGTVFTRNNASFGSDVLEVPASYVTLRDLTLEGGYHGLLASSNQVLRAESLFVRNNEWGILLNNSYDVNIEGARVWLNRQGGIENFGGRTTLIANATFVANSNFGIRVSGSVDDTLQNNIFYLTYSNSSAYAGSTNAIFSANIDYNVYYSTEPTTTIFQTSRDLLSWQIDRQKDYRSAFTNPLLNNVESGDFSLRSTQGRFATNGVWVNDAVSSWAIDRGNPASDYSRETAFNGGRVNIGAFGNTPFASRSSTNVILETRTLNSTNTIDDNSLTNLLPLVWGSINQPTGLIVNVQFSGDGGQSWTNIATGLNVYEEYFVFQFTPNFNTYKGYWRVIGQDGTNTVVATNQVASTVFFGTFRISQIFKSSPNNRNNIVWRGAWAEHYQVQQSDNGLIWSNSITGPSTNQTAFFLSTRGGDFTFQDITSTNTSLPDRLYRVLWQQFEVPP